VNEEQHHLGREAEGDRREVKSEERRLEKELPNREDRRESKRGREEEHEKKELETRGRGGHEGLDDRNRKERSPSDSFDGEPLRGQKEHTEHFSEDEVEHAAEELKRAEEAMEKAKAELRRPEEKAYQRRNDEILKGARHREEGFDSKPALCANYKSVQAEHLDAQPVRINTRNEGRGGETFLLLRLEESGREENLAVWKYSA
jgi:hypothetical protein